MRLTNLGHAARSGLFSVLFLTVCAAAGAQSFVNWENPPVHPVDLSPNGQLLAVCNLPDARVEFFDLSSGSPVLDAGGAVPVGIDPVAVRFRNDGEAWVVNFISDSVSVIDVATRRVIATIKTQDEPQDVVFAGNPKRAFVSCSQVNTVQVIDPDTRAVTGQVAIDAEEPRALAVSPDGSKVYAAIFESGNGSTLLGGGIVKDVENMLGRIGFPPNVVSDPLGPYGGQNPPPNSPPGPNGPFHPPINPNLPPPPPVGLIIKKDAAGIWRDDNGTDWTAFVSGPLADKSGRVPGWDLPDHDLAIIDAQTLGVTYANRLMNICMAVGVNPATGNISVVGTDAINEVRFEPNVNGKFVKVIHASVAPGGQTIEVNDLNPHLDYQQHTIPQEQRNLSIGDPRAIVWNSAGDKGYVTGMGSNNIIVINANGARIQQQPINVAEGPTGLVLDEARGRIYIFNRFASAITVLDIGSLAEVGRVPMYDSSPAAIKIGRKHFYNTHDNSGLGQLACASCHVDGKMDRLAWDLGDPSGAMKPVHFVLDDNPPGSTPGSHNLLGRGLQSGGTGLGQLEFQDFHPMKGPMTTQTFQDIIGHEPLHWRGDRNGLEEFNGAFIGLQGDDNNLSPQQMQEFEDMVATIYFQPNPFRNFDNTLPDNLPLPGHFIPPVIDLTTGLPKPEFPAGQPLPNGNARQGLALYADGSINPDAARNIDGGGLACVTCHTLPTGQGADLAIRQNPDLEYVPLVTGPLGEHHVAMVSVDGSTNVSMKIPQIRNAYDKTGCDMTQVSNRAGFGFLHDGSVDSLERFITEPVFDTRTPQELANLVAFSLAIGGSDLPEGTMNVASLEPPGPPSNDTHAGVGTQFTIAGAADVPTIMGKNGITAMTTEANKNLTYSDGDPRRGRGIDVIVKGKQNGIMRGWYWESTKVKFVSDLKEELTSDALKALAAPGSELTYTAVPKGSGIRLGVDRDLDGFFDRTEVLAGTNPADPNSIPQAPQVTKNAESQTVTSGQQVVFYIEASGSGVLNYQWFRGTTLLTGNTFNYLVIESAVRPGDNGSYTCKVTNLVGEAISLPADLLVLPSGSNDAQFVGAKLPYTLNGETEPAGVTFRNTSILTWSDPQNYRVKVVDDPSDLLGADTYGFNSVYDVVPTDIGEYTFTLPVNVPAGAGTYTAQVQMSQNGNVFGAVGTLTVNVNASPTWDFTPGAPEGWFGGVVSGTGSVTSTSGQGLCTFVPDDGENVAGWVSPARYISLVDEMVYRVRVTASTDQTAPNEIPFWDIIYDNYPNVTYGGEALFLDGTGGAMGIGRQRSQFEIWATPNAVLTPQWRGTLTGDLAGDNANSAFTPQIDTGNDIRIVTRLLDLANSGINAAIDSGTICVSNMSVQSYNVNSLTLDTPVFNTPLSNAMWGAEANGQGGAGLGSINDGNGTAAFRLTPSGAGNRRTLFPWDHSLCPIGGECNLLAFYPLSWESEQLYRGTVAVRSDVNAGGNAEGSDPVDIITVIFDAASIEQVTTHTTVHGGAGNMLRAASPRREVNAGGPQNYVGFFYGHTRSLQPPADSTAAGQFRIMADFFNVDQILGAGTDPLGVTGVTVQKATAPF